MQSYYKLKLEKAKVSSFEALINLFFTYPRKKSEISELQPYLDSDKNNDDFFNDILSSNLVFRLSTDSFISLQHLPFYLSCKTKSFSRKQNYSTIQNSEDILQLRETFGPETGLSLLIEEYLKFTGPSEVNGISKALGFTSNKIQPILNKLQREQIILVGSFVSTSQQYISLFFNSPGGL